MDYRALAMGFAFALMWSSAFATGHVIVDHAPPLHALALRFLISGLLGVGIALALGQTWRLSAGQWRATFIFGLCQNALYLGLNFTAMQTIDASVAAIVASTMPLMVALSGWLMRGERLRPLGLVGLAAGFTGVAIVMSGRISAGMSLSALLMCTAGVMALAFATLTVRGALAGGNLLMVVGLQMLVGSVLLATAASAVETLTVRWSWSLIAAFAYQVVVPGLIATSLWFALVNRIGAVRAATFHFLNPFFGVAVAALLLGEHIGWLDIVGVSVIMAGILAVQLSGNAAAERFTG